MGGVYTMERCAEVCNVLVAPVAEGQRRMYQIGEGVLGPGSQGVHELIIVLMN